jgi:streptogramin lyase
MSETLYAQGTLVNSQTNVTANGYILMDQTDRGPYLIPSTANAAVIQQWIQKTVNSYGKPFWCSNITYTATSGPTTPYTGGVLIPDGRIIYDPSGSTNIGTYNIYTNTFTSLLAGTLPGGNAYLGIALAPDGRVIFVPNSATNVGIFNPVTNSFTTMSTGVSTGYGFGAVLAGDGRIVFAPFGGTSIGVFNPATNLFTSYASGASGLVVAGYQGCVLCTDGRVVFVPSNATNVGTFNPNTNSFLTYAYSGSVPQGSGAYFGGVLIPDGRIVFVSQNAQNVGIFNPLTNTFITTAYSGTPGVTIPGGSGAYQGGCLLPDGTVLFNSQNATNLGIFNPTTNTFSTFAAGGASLGANAYQGALVVPDGRVILVSVSSNKVGIISGENRPVPPEFCLHPFFNKL